MQRDQRMKLSWTCEEQLFRQEIENADDVRLSVRLFTKCLPDKKKVGSAGSAGRLEGRQAGWLAGWQAVACLPVCLPA